MNQIERKNLVLEKKYKYEKKVISDFEKIKVNTSLLI